MHKMSDHATPPPSMEWKGFTGMRLEDPEAGTFEAVVATLGVVDHDKDYIRQTAIKEGARVVVSSYGHSAVFGHRPAGKGTMHIVGDHAVARGKLFMSTTEGKETRNYLLEMGEDAEWSFGYDPIGAERPGPAEKALGAERVLTTLDTFEVSPVLRGAGIGTRTLGVKSAATAQATAQADGVADDPTLGVTGPPPGPAPEPVPNPDRVPDDGPVVKASDAAVETKTLPTPSGGEDERAFVARCMADETMASEFPEQEQRAAVCYRQFREGKAAPDPAELKARADALAAETARAAAAAEAEAQAAIARELDRMRRTMRLYGSL